MSRSRVLSLWPCGLPILVVLLGACWDPTPFFDAHRLVFVGAEGASDDSVDRSCIPELKSHHEVFQIVAAYSQGEIELAFDGSRDQIRSLAVSENFFSVLGLQPLLGRSFIEDHPERFPVAVLNHSLWERRLAGSAAVIGDEISLDGVAATVIGVMPKGTQFPTRVESFDVAVPLVSGDPSAGSGESTVSVLARLQSDASLEEAKAAVASLSGEDCSGLAVQSLEEVYFAL